MDLHIFTSKINIYMYACIMKKLRSSVCMYLKLIMISAWHDDTRLLYSSFYKYMPHVECFC